MYIHMYTCRPTCKFSLLANRGTVKIYTGSITLSKIDWSPNDNNNDSNYNNMIVIPLVAGFVNGLLKVARLCWLFVNAIFYCLARTILARTWCGPKMMSYWKGYKTVMCNPGSSEGHYQYQSQSYMYMDLHSGSYRVYMAVTGSTCLLQGQHPTLS